MATINFEVTSYSITLSRLIGFDTRPMEGRANITVMGTKDKQLRCHFRFVDQPELPESVFHAQAPSAYIFLPVSHYPWYVDLLRNEKPVTCMVDTLEPGMTRLVTGMEAVGEGELALRS